MNETLSEKESTFSGYLTALETQSWEDVVQTMQGFRAWWVDLRGAHLGEVPKEQPIGSHLWSWTDGRWAKCRIDGDKLRAVMLTKGKDPGASPAEIVDCRHTNQVRWKLDDERIFPTSVEDLPDVLDVIEVIGPKPLFFLNGPKR